MPCAPASTNRAGQSWLQAGHPVITPRDVEANATQTGRSVVTGSSAYADDDDREYGNRLKLARMRVRGEGLTLPQRRVPGAVQHEQRIYDPFCLHALRMRCS